MTFLLPGSERNWSIRRGRWGEAGRPLVYPQQTDAGGPRPAEADLQQRPKVSRGALNSPRPRHDPAVLEAARRKSGNLLKPGSALHHRPS